MRIENELKLGRQDDFNSSFVFLVEWLDQGPREDCAGGMENKFKRLNQ